MDVSLGDNWSFQSNVKLCKTQNTKLFKIYFTLRDNKTFVSLLDLIL